VYETTFKHKFILGDLVRIKNDTSQKEYMIKSVSHCTEMEIINKQTIWSEVVLYTIMDLNFGIVWDDKLFESDLEKI